MQKCIQEITPPIALADPSDEWWRTVKASDEFLDRIFKRYLEKLHLPENLMRKSDYHRLARFVPRDLFNPEITEKLDVIVEVANTARPA